MNPPSLKTRRIPAYFVGVNAVLALAFGCFFLLTSIYFWIRFHLHFPAKDTLHLIPFVQSVLGDGFSSQSLADWLAPHAKAHRIAVMRLAMVIDYQYFGGQNHVMYALAWLGVAALLAVFAIAFKQSYKSESALFVFVIGVSLIFLSGATQAWNLINPINSSWYLAMSASAVGILLLTHRAGPPSAARIVIAYLLAVVGAYSNFSGVIVWLVLPVLIGFRSARAGLLTGVISAVFIALYLYGMDGVISGGESVPNTVDPKAMNPDTMNPDTMNRDTMNPGMMETEVSAADKLLGFVASRLIRGTKIASDTFSYLGAPLSITYPKWAAVLVLLSLLVIGAASRELLKYRLRGIGQHNAWLETMLAIAMVALGTAIATQLGRVHFSSPTADRYQTVVMLYWLCICCLVLYFGLKPARGQIGRKLISTTVCLGIATALLLVDYRSMKLAVKLSEAANRVSSLGVLDINETIDYGTLLPRRKPDFLPALNSYLKNSNSAYWYNVSRQISVDGAVECDWTKPAIAPTTWPGVSIATVHIQEQWPKLERQIPVTTARGEVIGFLSPVMAGEVTPLSIYAEDESVWTGYIRRRESPDEDVYLHYRTSLLSGVVCRLQR